MNENFLFNIRIKNTPIIVLTCSLRERSVSSLMSLLATIIILLSQGIWNLNQNAVNLMKPEVQKEYSCQNAPFLEPKFLAQEIQLQRSIDIKKRIQFSNFMLRLLSKNTLWKPCPRVVDIRQSCVLTTSVPCHSLYSDHGNLVQKHGYS